jgi:hypothetical protein
MPADVLGDVECFLVIARRAHLADQHDPGEQRVRMVLPEQGRAVGGDPLEDG